VTLTAVLVLAANAVGEVGVKMAVSESTPPVVNPVVVTVHVPLASVHVEVESAVDPFLKATVPAGAVVPEACATVAVSVTVEPAAKVAFAAGTVKVVVVATAVAWALFTAASKNSSRKATLTLHVRTREVIARNPFRVVTSGMDRISNIFKSSAME